MQETTRGSTEHERVKSETVLGRCLVDGDPEVTASARCRRRKTFGASLAIEVLLLALLVAIPLLTSVAEPRLHHDGPLDITFIRGQRDHNPIQHSQPTVAGHRHFLTLTLAPGTRNVPPQAHHEEESGDDPAPYVPGGDVAPGGIEVAEMSRPPFVPPPHIEPSARPEKRLVKLSEGVLEAQLISRIEPQYPFIAMETKTEGAVRLHAIISRDGRITSLDVVSGHPLLVKAALDAVRQWRYRPTLLNGEPVEVETSITVIFRLRPQ